MEEEKTKEEEVGRRSGVRMDEGAKKYRQNSVGVHGTRRANLIITRNKYKVEAAMLPSPFQ